MNKTFKCSICGKEFGDVSNYVSHVSRCAEDYKKKEAENLQKLNEDLNRVKAAKAYYEELLAKFEKKYPEAYKLNFGKSKEEPVKAEKSLAAGKRPTHITDMDVTLNGQKLSEEVVEDVLKELRKESLKLCEAHPLY